MHGEKPVTAGAGCDATKQIQRTPEVHKQHITQTRQTRMDTKSTCFWLYKHFPWLWRGAACAVHTYFAEVLRTLS